MSDDMSFCLDVYNDYLCDHYDCERHPCNIVDQTIPHSYMSFYGTEFCKKGKQMNFSDKIKDEEFMNLPEVEDDVEEEEDDVDDFLNKLIDASIDVERNKKMLESSTTLSVEKFLMLDEKLFNKGFADREERMRIIEIIWR